VLISHTLFGIRPHLRLVAMLGGGIAIALALITIGPHIRLGQSGTHPEGEMGGSVRAILDLGSLVHQSGVVVVGRIAGANPVGGFGQPGQPPTTVYRVDVESVVRGSPPAGQQIVVNGQVEDDASLNANGRYVLFLKLVADGSYFIVGGAQGALWVDGADNVHPVNPGSPPTHAYDGQSLSTFLAAVTAVP
jgi:hypothetical protein